MFYKAGCIALWLGCFVLPACHGLRENPSHKNLEASLDDCASEFQPRHFSYLIAQKGRIISEKEEDAVTDTDLFKTVQDHFAAPLILDKLIADSLICGQDSIAPGWIASDLIHLPMAYYDSRGEAENDMRTRVMRPFLERSKYLAPYDLTTGFPGKLKLQVPVDLTTLYRNCWQMYRYFDQVYPQYGFMGDRIYNVNPSWYTNGQVEFFGWRILRFQGQTLLWNYFVHNSYAILLVRSLEKETLAIWGYTVGSIPSPMDLNRQDPLQSPLVITLLKNLYLNEETIDPSYDFIYLHDLTAHIDLYSRTGRAAEAEKLLQIQARRMQDSLLPAYERKPVLAEIAYVPDNFKTSVPFSLARKTTLQIFSGGQIHPPYDAEANPWESDNIQFFINDHAGEKNNSFQNIRLFMFNYGSDKIRYQQNDHYLIHSPQDGSYACFDPTDTSYRIEARIAWKAVSKAGHRPGRKILANVLLGDADVDELWRKSVLSWAVHPGESYADEKKYGKIVLAEKSRAGDDSTVYAVRTSRPPVIDGKEEDLWQQATWSQIHLPYIGSVTPRDNAGRFKVLYDEDYLYLLFDITDNVKSVLGIVTLDKCWIEDAATGLPVWAMRGKFGPDYPGFSNRSRLTLPAGNYVLKYTSDKGHSYEHWYGKPPSNGIYGATIYPQQE
jgi:Carbohydrate family 9 binding domain-like